MSKILATLFTILPVWLFASKAFNLSNYVQPELIGTYCQVSEGNLGDSTLIFSKKTNWKSVDKPIIPIEKPENGQWIKTRIQNIDKADKRYLLEINLPTLDTLKAYVVKSKSVVRRFSYYESEPFQSRDISHQSYLIRLPKDLQEVDIYLYVSSSEQINLPISISSFTDQYIEATKRDLSFGIYIGIIFAMFFYNAFILYSTKDGSYLYYVIYILFVGLVQVALEGYGFKYLWPNYPNWQQISLNFLNLGTALFAYLFFQKFVHLQTLMPKWRWPFYIAIGLYVIQFILAINNYKSEAYSIMNATALLLSFLFIFASAAAIYKGSKQALFFMIAWISFLLSVIVFVLKDIGIVPYNLFTSNVLQIGSGLEVVLLSFGLANRISSLRKERDRSQKQALEVSLENEQIIKEQNLVLEERVLERTSELNQALLDVKNAQTQMVEQEKMASLGQLTAGIAHEINNPINFVSANINPLKRDLDDIFELIHQYDKIQNKEDFDAKKEEIEEYKEEIEIDYVLKEVNELIAGIKDGATRTAEIVKGLKIFSRTDELDLKKVDLIIGIESTLTLLKSSMNGVIDIEKDFESIERVECYGGKINQVFMNILSNSIQAIQEKNIKDGCIKIATRNLDNYISISIKDNAGGIQKNSALRYLSPSLLLNL